MLRLPSGISCSFGAELGIEALTLYTFSQENFNRPEAEVFAEVARVLRPGGHLVVVGLSRPPGERAAALHRAASAVFLPTAGSLIGAREEYAYLHESLDKLPPPREMFGGGPLRVQRIWRMGPLGFVYGAVLVND